MHKVTVDDAGSTVKGCSLGQAERAGRGIAHGKCAALKRGLVLSKGCGFLTEINQCDIFLPGGQWQCWLQCATGEWAAEVGEEVACLAPPGTDLKIR